MACQERSGWLSGGDDPATAYLPFDARARGYVPGEGGAIFVVEDLDRARARGAEVYGEIAGWAATHDGASAARRGPVDGGQYARAMRGALERASVPPEAVDMVVPDALGVPEYDVAECSALRTVFGPAGPAAVSTHKSLVGRLYQGGSALDVATALMAIRTGRVPPSAAPEQPAPACDLAFVGAEGGPGPVDSVLIAARGFGGFNSALVVRRVEDAERVQHQHVGAASAQYGQESV
jgi:minimal PKS chain-length factor (CLF/KS beta)